MTSLATLDELRELLDITQQCMAQALAAQRQVARYVDHYRFQAEEFRRLAARAHSPEMRARFLRIAASHERLARLATGENRPSRSCSEATTISQPSLSDEETPKVATEGLAEVRRKPVESALAQARRHVAQAEDHVARQKTLIERLSKDEKHHALAAEAREILHTLEHTLELARQHLALELKK
jgi:hypothetical protein